MLLVVSDLSSHVSYDELPYDGGCVQSSHPSRMRAMGRLFGLDAPDPAHARVLELGCGGGSNIIPLAYGLPNAAFVGIDLSPRQIEIATERARQLGLTNLRLEAMDIQDATAIEGTFDYIICHGVYSWVPEAVRHAILSLVRQKLSPNGIAFLSYNTLPGWHLRRAVRDMMVYHGRYFPETEERTSQARALVDFVADATAILSPDVPGLAIHGAAIGSVRSLIANFPDYYVAHEFLESDNKAFYLYQFVDHVDAAGIQYLGDANFSAMVSYNLPAEVAATLERISVTNVALEQYRDFLVNRTFRHSLLCHADIELRREIPGELAREFSFRVSHGPDDRTDSPNSAPGADGRLIAIGSAAREVVGALRNVYPAALTFPELRELVSDGATPRDDEEFGRLLLSLLAHDIVEIHAGPMSDPPRVGERPKAWPPAMLFGLDGLAVPSRFHQSLSINAAGRKILELLDGTRTVAEILLESHTRLAQPGMTFAADDGTVDGPDLTREQSDELTTKFLEAFGVHGALDVTPEPSPQPA